MVKPPSNFTNAFKVLQVTASGGATVLLSTFTSCYLATVIEKTAHRVQYHFFPHKYKDVDFALGLDLHKKVYYSGSNIEQRKKSEMEKEIDINTDIIETIDDLRVGRSNSSEWSDIGGETRRIIDDTLFTTATSSSFDEINSRITSLNQAEANFDASQLDQNHAWERSVTTKPQHQANQSFEETIFEPSIATTHTHMESALPLDENQNSTIPTLNSLRDNRNSDERSISSRIESFMKVVGSSSSENASNVLQSCAMTA